MNWKHNEWSCYTLQNTKKRCVQLINQSFWNNIQMESQLIKHQGWVIWESNRIAIHSAVIQQHNCLGARVLQHRNTLDFKSTCGMAAVIKSSFTRGLIGLTSYRKRTRDKNKRCLIVYQAKTSIPVSSQYADFGGLSLYIFFVFGSETLKLALWPDKGHAL